MASKVSLQASNVDILNTVRANASSVYRNEIPVATTANIAKTVAQIKNFEPFWNEFLNVLINKIALTVFNESQFNNKLAPLKLAAMNYGGVIEEMGADLINAEEYDPDATNVFEAPKPDVRVNYHQINRRNIYPMRLNEDLLSEAFRDSNGLSSFVNNMLALPVKSAEWDEYRLMRDLLGIYQQADGFTNVQVPDLATSADPEADGKKITELLREYYLTLKDFYHTEFNAEGINSTSSDLILLGTPKFFARLDVNVLAAAYNMDKADFIADRTIVVDSFGPGMEGTQCMLLDDRWYKVADTKRKMTSIYNPRADEWVYYNIVWQVLSCSRMVNALRFSTDATSGKITAGDSVTVTSTAVTSDGTNLAPGAEIKLTATVTYSDDSTDADAYFILTGSTETAPTGGVDSVNVILPDTGTYVDRMGVLHVAEDSTYDTIVVTAVATKDSTKTGNVTISKAGD